MIRKIYWFDLDCAGKLGTMACPRGTRQLKDDLQIVEKNHVNVMISLLEMEEIYEFGLKDEGPQSEAMNIHYLNYPIRDRHVPIDMASFHKLTKQLYQLLIDGKNISIHCKMGVGRSTLLACGILRHFGMPFWEAAEMARNVRGFKVPNTILQVKFLEEYYQYESTVELVEESNNVVHLQPLPPNGMQTVSATTVARM